MRLFFFKEKPCSVHFLALYLLVHSIKPCAFIYFWKIPWYMHLVHTMRLLDTLEYKVSMWYFRQWPLKKWTEHSNCKYIVGGTQNSLTDAQYFHDFFMKLFFYAYKSWGHDPIWYFHVFVENSVNSELCFFWALLKPAKIWNLLKNAHVWAA